MTTPLTQEPHTKPGPEGTNEDKVAATIRGQDHLYRITRSDYGEVVLDLNACLNERRQRWTMAWTTDE